MSKDLINLRKWFKDLGLEIDEELNNDVLKKLVYLMLIFCSSFFYPVTLF